MSKNSNIRTLASVLLAVTLTAVGCSSERETAILDDAVVTGVNGSEAPVPIDSVANPITEQDVALPDGYRIVFARDAIDPIYEPEHVAADQIGWSDETLIIGARVNDESRAYPIDHLNRREIVNDTLDGLPILVTW